MRKEFKFFSVFIMLFLGQEVLSQIVGKVEEFDGEPAMGAKVLIKGTSVFVRTNDDGVFELSEAKVGDILEITNLDDEKQEVVASQNMIFKFSKTNKVQKTKNIEAVTIIGSIRIDPNEEIGSSPTLKSDVFNSTPSASVNEALSGRVAGVDFGSAGGHPGSANNITIRGVNSFTGSSNPLYVIDGVPIGRGTDDSQLLSSYASFNPLASLDPNSIESVTILKDVVGTSLYGAQGANGVILIKTKSGKYNQKTRFSFSTETGYQDIAFDRHKWMNSSEYLEWGALSLAGEAYLKGDKNAYSNLATYRSTYKNTLVGLGWDGESSTDWEKEVRRKSSTVTQYSFNAVGGGENTSFNIGASYYENKPLILNSGFKRISANIGLNHKASDKLNFTFNGNVSNLKNNAYSGGGSFSNPWNASWNILPIYPVRNSDGTFNINKLGAREGFNLVELLQSDFLHADLTNFLGNVGMDYRFVKNFKFSSNFATSYRLNNERSWWNQFTGDGASRSGLLQTSNTRVFDYDWTNFVQYKNKFSDIHDITLDLGIDYQEHSRRFEYISAREFPKYVQKPEISWATVFSSGGGKESWSQISYIGRLAYVLDKKYTFTASIRRDGNSTFSSGQKWGNFWNLGLMWDLKKESFLVDNASISGLKLRTFYGISGNTPMTEWGNTQLFRPLLRPRSYSDDNTSSLEIRSPGNDNLKWETSYQYGIGLDIGFLNNRITGNIDYYNRRTDNLIAIFPLPYTVGGPNSYRSNVGEIRNTGLEVTLGGTPIKTEKILWTITAIFSTNKSKVLDLETVSTDGLNLIQYHKALKKGKQVGEYYTWGWAGVNPETGRAQWYMDETKTKVTEDKRQAKRFFQGSTSLPIYQTSLLNEISYKGFKLSILLSGSFDYKLIDGYTQYFMGDGQYLNVNNQDPSMLYDSWRPGKEGALHPIQNAGNSTQSNSASSRFLRKGDHIRLKDLKASYTFNKSILGDIGIDEVTVYFRATNLITWVFDKQLRSDPESYSPTPRANNYPDFYGKGFYDFASPVMRTYSFGIVVNF